MYNTANTFSTLEMVLELKLMNEALNARSRGRYAIRLSHLFSATQSNNYRRIAINTATLAQSSNHYIGKQSCYPIAGQSVYEVRCFGCIKVFARVQIIWIVIMPRGRNSQIFSQSILLRKLISRKYAFSIL